MIQSCHYTRFQPIQALEHPSFQELVGVASRAKHGVDIPGRKSTRGEILNLFKDYIIHLRTVLSVSVSLPSSCFWSHVTLRRFQGQKVKGKISLTCDAWQASNTDGYFAVTAHWTSATTPTNWGLSSALIGFTRVNNAHVGIRLGQALFKIVKRVGIENKVRHYALTRTIVLTSSLFTSHSSHSHCHEDWPRHLRQCEQ